MTDRIRILEDSLVDQIAAGEVVERPASVIRELVDNAIDASASKITVEIEEGGVKLIRVTDDGIGMSAADARLALRRHATSKLRAADDLLALHTLGFRGEALPSIASVSKLTLTTRQREDIAATRIIAEGTAEPVTSDAGAPPGTSIEIRDLFFNVPARRKFLKAQATESAHAAEVVEREALSRPHIHFSLRRDGRHAREFLPVSTRKERVEQIFDISLNEVHGERDGIAIEAFLSAPSDARSGATALQIFVNQRHVRDRALARAAAFAYGGEITAGRFPAGVIYITMPTEDVDVNVHPQKAEVRFAKPRVVLEAMHRVLSQGLSNTTWHSTAERLRTRIPKRLGLTENASTAGELFRAAVSETDVFGPQIGQIAEPHLAYRTVDGADDTPFANGFRTLAQLRNNFLVCESPMGIVILDQHAADERIRFTSLLTSFNEKRVTTQRLLFPERVEIAEEAAQLAAAHTDDLAALGIEVTRIGNTSLAVHTVPALVARAPAALLFWDAFHEFAHPANRAPLSIATSAFASMACRAAIQYDTPLSIADAQQLGASFGRVAAMNEPIPHARAILATIPFDDLERKVHR